MSYPITCPLCSTPIGVQHELKDLAHMEYYCAQCKVELVIEVTPEHPDGK